MNKKTRDYYLYCGIKLSWHEKELSDFTNDEDALSKVKSYFSNLQEMKLRGLGMFLWGANGCGKTMLMNCAFKELIKQGQKVHIFSLTEIVNKYTASWYSSEDRQELHRILLKADFLGIDEFGKNVDADGEANYIPDIVKRVIDEVIRYRVQMNKPLWITSNTEPKYIKKVFTEDIASLLREAVIAVHVTGKDFRKVIQDRNKELL